MRRPDPRVLAPRSTQTRARQMNSRQGEAAQWLVQAEELGHTLENQLWLCNQEGRLRGRSIHAGRRGLTGVTSWGIGHGLNG